MNWTQKNEKDYYTKTKDELILKISTIGGTAKLEALGTHGWYEIEGISYDIWGDRVEEEYEEDEEIIPTLEEALKELKEYAEFLFVELT